MHGLQVHQVNESPVHGKSTARGDRAGLKVSARYRLECGHEGRVVWISPTGDTFAVKGVTRSCRICGKRTSGEWSPSVYLFSRNERTAQHRTHWGQGHFRRVPVPDDTSIRAFNPLLLEGGSTLTAVRGSVALKEV